MAACQTCPKMAACQRASHQPPSTCPETAACHRVSQSLRRPSARSPRWWSGRTGSSEEPAPREPARPARRW
eukprot:scaffold21487_cov63-Phaeocystis_antarctica.AAC.3